MGSNLWRAFDEAAFGPSRTLNLRASLPTAREAVDRLERWLRQQQMERAGEVLVITGRGNNSPDGVSVVRVSVLRHLHSLRRRGVVKAWREHTPGSVVIELAAVGALFEQAQRRREPRIPPERDPSVLAGLSAESLSALRQLAVRSLEALGVSRPGEAYIEAEMVKQFSALARGLPTSGDSEATLRRAVAHALDELDG